MLPVAQVILPTDLKSQPNGALDVSLMVSIGDRGQLHHLAARAWRAFASWATKNGVPLTYSYGGTYRTYEQQVSLFKRRYTTSFIAGQPRKWWNGQWWYLRKDPTTGRSVASAATPGTSNHGLGLAIDMAYDRDLSDGIGPDDAAGIGGHPKFALIRDNAIRFGFSFEDQTELWHVRYVAGDKLPQAVLDYEKAVLGGDNIPMFDPAHGYWGLWPLAKKAAAKVGDKGDRVKYLEGVLRLRCGQNVSVDGVYDLQTEQAVRNIQLFFGLSVDGWVGAETWKTIDWLATK